MDRARVTLMDVAADAKVSRATVSLVVRDSPLVAEATRARVRASMEKLGYVYHRGAASLRSKRSNTVGLLVTDVSNPFYSELTVGVEAALAEAGTVVLLGHNYESLTKQGDLFRVMQEYGADGLLITPAHRTTAADLEPLLTARLPHLLIARYVEGHPAPYVGADLGVMEADTRRMRRDKPYVMTNLKTREGLAEVVQFIERKGMLHAQRASAA